MNKLEQHLEGSKDGITPKGKSTASVLDKVVPRVVSRETDALVSKVKGKHVISSLKASDERKVMLTGRHTRAQQSKVASTGMRHIAKSKHVNKGDKGTTQVNMVPLPPPPPKYQVKQPSDKSFIVQALQDLLASSEAMHQPKLFFDTTTQAAEDNITLLRNNDFDLDKLTQVGPKSVLTYGSEFKSTSLLAPLLHKHPRWATMRQLLDDGAKFPLKSITENERVNDLMGRLDRGNHKSAAHESKFLAEALKKEIHKGWLLPLPAEAAVEIPNMEIAPLGVATHLGVNADGDFIPKQRVTHDLSFPGAYTESSVNSRVVENELEPCMFGFMLTRLVHYIVHMRRTFPHKRIWLRKEDFKSAFRRVHLNVDTAWKSVVRMVIDDVDLLLVSLRLPFGGAPCPSGFCLLSDVLTDLINDLLNDDTWNHEDLKSDFTANIPPAKALDEDIPFEQGLEMSIDMPHDTGGKADVYIDDIISCAVDDGDNLKRLETAPCTVLEAVAHSAKGSTFITRQHFISNEKNEAEGAAEEVKICLGWELDTRRLLVALPEHKFIAWHNEIEIMMKGRTVSNKTLQSILGRLETVASVLTPMGHFLNNIRSLQIKAEAAKQHNVAIPKGVYNDLKLAQKFLQQARQGVNMNLMTFRKPNLIFIGDASEHGLGGYDTKGRAWRYLIPTRLQGRAHINLLEFMTQVVGIWLAIEEGRLSKLDCVLAMGDSTTALGWMRRSNFRALDEENQDWIAKQKLARKLGTLSLEAEISLYKQWFKGEDNVVADSLSRDLFYLSASSHQKFLSLAAPAQLPHNFRILPLPAKISSFISSTLQLLPVQEQRLVPQKPSELAHGNTGILSYILSDSKLHHSSKVSTSSNATLSSPPLPKPSGKVLTLAELENTWWKAQSTPPCHMWLRPLGQATGQTQDWTRTERCVSC